MNKRDAMLDKIRGLRAKTETSGCTEAEAMAAAQLAANLMAKWEVEEAELAWREERAPDLDLGREETFSTGRNRPKWWACGYMLERLTRCRLVTTSLGGGFKFTIVGDRPDREFLLYLIRLIDTSMDREYLRYRIGTNGRVGQGAKASFQLGMASRINERIRGMIKERDGIVASSSRALVLVDTKSTAVQQHMNKLFPKLGKVGVSYSSSNGGAFSAGKAAGDRVGLSRGLGHDTRQIG